MSLEDRWNLMSYRAGVDPIFYPFAELMTRYAEPHRRYHTSEHLEDVFERLDASREPLWKEDKAALALAVFYHDAVYDLGAADNEIRSALLLHKLPFPEHIKNAAVEAILGTAPYHTPTSTVAQLLSDADLGVLAGSPKDYDDYAWLVRQEFLQEYTPEEYNAGRRGALASLLAKPELFFYSPESEPAARANMERELQSLCGL